MGFFIFKKKMNISNITIDKSFIENLFEDEKMDEKIEIDEKIVNKYNLNEEEKNFYKNILSDDKKPFEENEFDKKYFDLFLNNIFYFIYDKMEFNIQQNQFINAGFFPYDCFKNIIKKYKQNSNVYLRKLKNKNFFFKKFKFDKDNDLIKNLSPKFISDVNQNNLDLNIQNKKIELDYMEFNYNFNYNYIKIKYTIKFYKFIENKWIESF
jgi:hypothetical protein